MDTFLRWLEESWDALLTQVQVCLETLFRMARQLFNFLIRASILLAKLFALVLAMLFLFSLALEFIYIHGIMFKIMGFILAIPGFFLIVTLIAFPFIRLRRRKREDSLGKESQGATPQKRWLNTFHAVGLNSTVVLGMILWHHHSPGVVYKNWFLNRVDHFLYGPVLTIIRSAPKMGGLSNQAKPSGREDATQSKGEKH